MLENPQKRTSEVFPTPFWGGGQIFGQNPLYMESSGKGWRGLKRLGNVLRDLMTRVPVDLTEKPGKRTWPGTLAKSGNHSVTGHRDVVCHLA
jgi:hypothetical protein